MTGDVHSPTAAGPDVDPPVAAALAGEAPAPASGPAEDPHPEILAGAAFAGGLLTAIILKRLGSD